jgi:hypothetical protein
MLTFLNPLMLIGLMAAAIPLIIHLSRSRRTKKMRFSTTRFFTDQFLRSYRMSRLKELFLLACRMALCALLAVAFAQPLVQPEGLTLFGGGARAVVLVIDDSASMGCTEDGQSQLDRARKAARAVIQGMGPDDTVSVVLAGRRAAGPRVVCANKPYDERGDVLEELKRLNVATVGTDLTEAVVRAEELARSSQAAGKEVYVLSDLQTSSWDRQNEKLKAGKVADVHFFFVPLRPRQPANVGITAVQYLAPRPMAGVPFSIRPLLTTQGGYAPNTLVRLYVYNRDGQPEKVAERPLEKRPQGGWSAPRFYHTFTTGGWHAGYVEVQDEHMPQDNRRYFALQIIDGVDVLAINGTPSQVQDIDRDPVFFLRAALLAANFQVKKNDTEAIRVKVDTPAALADIDLARYPLVVLANVARLAPRSVEKLEQYVDRGGSLLVFLGDNVDAEFYNENLAGENRPHGGLLPGKLGREKGYPHAGLKDAKNYAGVASLAYSHPALASFEDAKNGNLAGVTLRALWEIQPREAETTVLMYARELEPKAAGRKKDPAASRLPLLCERRFGKGRVLMFASTCNRARTNFPMSSSFLPWMHQLVCYLAQKPVGQHGFFLTGEAVSIPVAQSEGVPAVVVRKPDGSRGYPSLTNDPDNPLEFTDTVQAGVYTLHPDRKDRRQMFAVNLDPYESKLTYLDDVLAGRAGEGEGGSANERVQAGLKELLPGRPLVHFVADPSQVVAASQEARQSINLWEILLWVVLVLVLFEPWLANRISVRHYARPRELPQPETPRAGRWAPVPAPEPTARQQEVPS